MMAVKSRIPQGRSTKLQGCGNPSRLPQYSSNRAKPLSLLPPGGNTLDKKQAIHPPDNYKLTFPKPTDTGFAVDPNANDGDGGATITASTDDDTVNGNLTTNDCANIFENSSGNTPQEAEDNCEILSLCSVEPSPLKTVVGYHTEENSNFADACNLDETSVARSNGLTELHLVTEALQHTDAVPQHKHQRSLESHTSETSSTCSSATDFGSSGNSKLLTKNKSSLSKRNQPNTLKQVSTERLKAPPATSLVANSVGRSHDKASKVSQNRTSVKQKRIPLPPKAASRISASDAMDYVKRITSQGEDQSTLPNERRYGSTSRGSSNGITDYPKPSRKFPTSTTSQQNRRNNGKWSKDLESAMNLNKVSNKMSFSGEVASSSSIRAERKKMYQESKSLSKLNGPGTNDRAMPLVSEEANENSTLNEVLTGSKQMVGGIRKHGSPRIARPVMRPPRQRTRQPPQTHEEDDDPPEDTEQAADPNEEDKEYVSKMVRRSSVPASPDKVFTTPRSRQRRRASEAIHLHQHLITDVTEEETTMESGDSLATDIARRKDKWKLNERYRDILQNPNVVNFGQWRVKREGNYAPEEKYGITERRRIRSSTDSDSVSPIRKVPDSSLSEQGNTDDDVTQEEDVKGLERSKVEVERKNRSSTLDSPPATSDDPFLGELDDLPSLNSTAMMVDYSLGSTDPNNSHVQERRVFKLNQTVSPERLDPLPEKIHNGVATDEEPDPDFPEVAKRSELRGLEVGYPALHSSPLKHGASRDDVSKFKETTPSSGDLATKMEEMLQDNKTVRSNLEHLYVVLNNEEEEKAKVKSENERLRNKNDLLTEEVNRLTRIMEMSQPSPGKFSSNRHAAMRDASSQTDGCSKVWYKTQLSSVKNDLVDTLEQFNELLKKRKEFDHSVSETKRKLYVLLEGISES